MLKELKGTWHIYEMEEWDEDYFNMEVQAYITIQRNGLGEFQFGLVCGDLDGRVVTRGGESFFEFTWEGNDELDPASGSGWIQLTEEDEDEVEGEFKLHQGDTSTFSAQRA